MQNKNYNHYSCPAKLFTDFKEINQELQHYTMKHDQAVRHFTAGYV